MTIPTTISRNKRGGIVGNRGEGRALFALRNPQREGTRKGTMPIKSGPTVHGKAFWRIGGRESEPRRELRGRDKERKGKKCIGIREKGGSLSAEKRSGKVLEDSSGRGGEGVNLQSVKQNTGI